MTPVVVAWVLQLAWEITRCALGADGLAGPPYSLSTAVTLATTIVLALGFAGITRRMTGIRRAGALVACGAQLVMVGAFATREILLQAHSSYAFGFARALRNGGWTALDVVAIIGLAIAAGRRGRWLAPPAIGLVVFALPPSTIYVTQLPWLSLVCRALAVAICIVLVDDARRAMSAREPKPAAAVRGVVLAERVCWFFAAINVASLATGGAFTIGPSITVAIANVVGETVFIIGAWWIASAGIARLPRWPLYAVATCSLVYVARTARNWLLTLFLHWGQLGSVPLHPAHWAYGIPALLSMMFGLIAYGVYARRTGRSAVLVAVAAAAACIVGQHALWIVGAGHQPAELALLGANLASAVLFRMLRPAFQAEIPPEMPAARLV